MIQFKCSGCGRPFSVPREFAGRSATCKSCGSAVTVPATSTATAPTTSSAPAPAPASAPVPKIPMRTRRLLADARQMTEAFATSPIIKVRPVAGDPPEAYHIEYVVRGLERGKGKSTKPTPREHHLVEIRLTSDYPRLAPQCKMLTPIFHPNIDPATICVGDHWTAGERLVDLTIRIGEMIAYQAYNIQSPLDAEAAMWADLNQKDLPTDARSIRPEES